jgi:hypothetical protein
MIRSIAEIRREDYLSIVSDILAIIRLLDA